MDTKESFDHEKGRRDNNDTQLQRTLQVRLVVAASGQILGRFWADSGQLLCPEVYAQKLPRSCPEAAQKLPSFTRLASHRL
jgi:hypothetical protein